MVSFSGIDGAGKSTQIETLRSRVQEAGLRVVLITFWDDVARLTRVREVYRAHPFQGRQRRWNSGRTNRPARQERPFAG